MHMWHLGDVATRVVALLWALKMMDMLRGLAGGTCRKKIVMLRARGSSMAYKSITSFCQQIQWRIEIPMAER
jgi:hypothetical protein